MRKDCPKNQTNEHSLKIQLINKEHYKWFQHETIVRTYYNSHYSFMVSHS